jgi:hypothetical protein
LLYFGRDDVGSGEGYCDGFQVGLQTEEVLVVLETGNVGVGCCSGEIVGADRRGGGSG